jgi:hypothetical protein
MENNQKNMVKIKPEYKHLLLCDAERIGDEAFAESLGITYEELKSISYSELKITEPHKETNGRLLTCFEINFDKESNPAVFEKLKQNGIQNPLRVSAGCYIDMYDPLMDDIFEMAETEVFLGKNMTLDDVFPIPESSRLIEESEGEKGKIETLNKAVDQFSIYLEQGLQHLILLLAETEQGAVTIAEYAKDKGLNEASAYYESELFHNYESQKELLTNYFHLTQPFEGEVNTYLKRDFSKILSNLKDYQSKKMDLRMAMYSFRSEFRNLVVRWYIAADLYTDIWAEEMNECFGEELENEDKPSFW